MSKAPNHPPPPGDKKPPPPPSPPRVGKVPPQCCCGDMKVKGHQCAGPWFKSRRELVRRKIYLVGGYKWNELDDLEFVVVAAYATKEEAMKKLNELSGRSENLGKFSVEEIETWFPPEW